MSMLRGSERIAIAFLFLCCSCGQPKDDAASVGQKNGNQKANQPPREKPASPPKPSNETNPLTDATNRRPFLQTPALRAVGVGDTVSFGINVIDPEMDRVRVDLVESPASAEYDPYTLTVVWTPTSEEPSFAKFRVKLTESLDGAVGPRITHRSFSIVVSPERVPPPLPRMLEPAVEQVLTIHDPVRLAEVNKDWPLDLALARAAQVSFPGIKKRALAKTGKSLYRGLLRELAQVHENPLLDPKSRSFAKKKLGRAKPWQIVAVRPRLDRDWFELRLVYRAPIYEDLYVMLGFRLVSQSENSDEAREWNNKTMTRLAWSAFFERKGALVDSHWLDRKAHAKAVAQFVASVLNFKTSEKEWAGASFTGAFCSGRLGGGSVRSLDGEYDYGTGWAWNKAGLSNTGKRVSIVGAPLPAVASAVNGEGEMACAAPFTNGDDGELCEKDTGGVFLPGLGQGYADHEVGEGALVPAVKDAPHMFKRFKRRQIVGELPLHDPRRDKFDDRALTCAQCHQRQFSSQTALMDGLEQPSPISPTFFVMTPGGGWSNFMLEFQHSQACAVTKAFKKYAGVSAQLGCDSQQL